MEKTKKTGTLVECSVLIAMAFVLSFIKIIDMPYGGAVTAASMLHNCRLQEWIEMGTYYKFYI